MAKSWVNPYKPLVEQSPRILSCSGGRLSEKEESDLAEQIGRYEEIRCELGSGSGSFLNELAKANPKILFIGFELRFKRIFVTAKKAEQGKLENVLCINLDARKLASIFKPSSLGAVYVNFPDPWEKKRWRKHRLLTKSFLSDLATLLKPNGVFAFKTDHRDYFDEVVKIVGEIPLFSVAKHSLDLHKSEFNVGNVPTEFEMLFISKGLPTFFIEAIKIGV